MFQSLTRTYDISWLEVRQTEKYLTLTELLKQYPVSELIYLTCNTCFWMRYASLGTFYLIKLNELFASSYPPFSKIFWISAYNNVVNEMFQKGYVSLYCYFCSFEWNLRFTRMSQKSTPFINITFKKEHSVSRTSSNANKISPNH